MNHSVSRKIGFVFLVLLMAGIISNTVTAASKDVDLKISLSADTIDAGGDFDVILEITNKEDNDIDVEIDIEIYANGVLVHEDTEKGIDISNSTTITIGSNDFETDDGEVWDEGLMAYACDDVEIEVKISGEVSKESDDATLEIEGDELKIKVEPTYPLTTETIIVTVTDDDGDELDDIKGRIIQLEDGTWDIGDEMEEDESDDDGEIIFDSIENLFSGDLYGNYLIEVWEDGYCKETKTITVENTLKITDAPETAYTAEDIKVRILDREDTKVEGATIAISGKGGIVGTYSTDSNGYATFQIKDSGSYTLLASKNGYINSETTTVTVSNREGLTIKAEPSEQSVGKDVILSITAKGSPINGAEVEIRAPNGAIQTLYTSAAGKVTYKPELSGTYDVSTKKEGYLEATSSFAAINYLTAELADRTDAYEDVTIRVKDQNNNPVSGAQVVVEGTSISGTTGSGGEYTFSITSAGEFTVRATKQDYTDYSSKIKSYDSITIKAEPSRINLDGSILISVFDSNQNAIDANIVITKPDAEKINVKKKEYNFTPQFAGEYTVTASMDYYSPANTSFSVKGYQISLEAKLDGEYLLITATSLTEPIENISLSFSADGNTPLTYTTDYEGVAKIDLREFDEDMQMFTVSTNDLRYEPIMLTTELKELKSNIGGIILIAFAAILILVVVIAGGIFLSQKKRSGLGSNSLDNSRNRRKPPKGSNLGGKPSGGGKLGNL